MMTIGRQMKGCRIETEILLPGKKPEPKKCRGQKIAVKSRIKAPQRNIAGSPLILLFINSPG